MAPRKIKKVSSKAPVSKFKMFLEGLPYVVFGILFGFFLSKSRATDYDSIVAMFRCREFHLYGVILVAIAVTALGLFLLRLGQRPLVPQSAKDWKSLKWNPSRLVGALVFGAGWGLAGTCPATALAQIGEGKLMAFVTVIGIAAGVWAYRKIKPIGPDNNDPVC